MGSGTYLVVATRPKTVLVGHLLIVGEPPVQTQPVASPSVHMPSKPSQSVASEQASGVAGHAEVQ